MGRAHKRKLRKALQIGGASVATGIMLAFGTSSLANLATADDTSDPSAPVVGDDVTVTANAPVYVRAAGLKLTKTASPSVIQPGGKTTYTYTLANTGSTLFNNVRLKDDGCTAFTGPTGNTGTAYLGTGETWTWKCVTGALTADANTTATATATPVVNPTASPSPTTTASSSPTSPSGGGVTDGTYSGDVVNITGSECPNSLCGTLGVKITVSGGKITAASYPTFTVTETTSQLYGNAALPDLVTKAISTQSSSLGTVSGASYTSKAFSKSLQSAMVKAGY